MATNVILLRPSRCRTIGGNLVFLAIIALLFSLLASGVDASTEANRSNQASLAQAATLSAPAPMQTETAVGPWKMTVLEIVVGEAATALVTDASPFNEASADGFTYVAAKVRVINAGSLSYRIDFNDFGVVGDQNSVRRFIGATPPEPALDAVLAPGEHTEGWIVAAAPIDAANLLLIYDSVTIDGTWADTAFSLTDGALIPPVEKRPISVNKIGRDPNQPIGLNTEVVTRDWAIEIIEVVEGPAVVSLFRESDYRTTALLGNNPETSLVSATWIAFKVKITNNRTGDEPAYFPLSAFTFADETGNPLPDLQTLSAPRPEAAGYYLPGSSREGWVLIDRLIGTDQAYDGAMLRFVPYGSDRDVRYIAWDGSADSVPDEPSFSGTLALGTTVEVTEDLVNLRDNPSKNAEIVDELSKGTVLTITGAPQDGDGITWYPVENPQTGDQGFIAQQLIAPID